MPFSQRKFLSPSLLYVLLSPTMCLPPSPPLLLPSPVCMYVGVDVAIFPFPLLFSFASCYCHVTVLPYVCVCRSSPHLSATHSPNLHFSFSPSSPTHPPPSVVDAHASKHTNGGRDCHAHSPENYARPLHLVQHARLFRPHVLFSFPFTVKQEARGVCGRVGGDEQGGRKGSSCHIYARVSACCVFHVFFLRSCSCALRMINIPFSCCSGWLCKRKHTHTHTQAT